MKITTGSYSDPNPANINEKGHEATYLPEPHGRSGVGGQVRAGDYPYCSRSSGPSALSLHRSIFTFTPLTVHRTTGAPPSASLRRALSAVAAARPALRSSESQGHEAGIKLCADDKLQPGTNAFIRSFVCGLCGATGLFRALIHWGLLHK